MEQMILENLIRDFDRNAPLVRRVLFSAQHSENGCSLGCGTWVLIEGDVALVGIFNYGQNSLDQLCIESILPQGQTLRAGVDYLDCDIFPDEMGFLSGKQKLPSPVSGLVLAARSTVSAADELQNLMPSKHIKGWIYKIQLDADFNPSALKSYETVKAEMESHQREKEAFKSGAKDGSVEIIDFDKVLRPVLFIDGLKRRLLEILKTPKCLPWGKK